MDQIGTAVAADAINKLIVAPLLRQIGDVIHLVQSRGLLQAKVERMELFLRDIRNAFENKQRTVPGSILHCLDSTGVAIEEAKSLIDRSQPQKRCLDCIFCKPRISRRIRECNSIFYQNLQELQTLFLTFASAQQIASSSAPPPAKELLQPLPEWGLVGMDIKSAETQLQTWLTEAPQLRRIGVYGMAGVGKTTLLKSVYNFYKVSDVFDVVIWVSVSQDYKICVTVSQDYKIWDLQHRIAKALKLDLSGISDLDTDTLKMALSATLIKKKFLLMLDDVWSPLDLQQELGVEFGNDKASKVVFSTRSRELAVTEARESLKVKVLSTEEGRELFQRVAFKDGHVPEELKECARDFADECEGLPLAITVVAAAMSGKRTLYEWNSCLSLMRNADPSFPDTHPRVDRQLYRRLRWSYDDLSKTPNLQHCFLYCAMYTEDQTIHVDFMVLMWIAEGFVKDMDLGRRYVKMLIDRGLFQSFNFEKQSKDITVDKPVNVWKERYITVHDVIRDMAIYIGEKEENYLCRAGQRLKDFPNSLTQDCKRISVCSNQIESLPTDFVYPKLLSLMLCGNPQLSHVPENFLINLTSLRVLDLSQSGIESVPASLTQLTLLEVLDLNSTRIKELPQDICNLSKLLYCDLSFCKNLRSLPYTLPQLQHLLLQGCNNLVLPAEIFQVTSLQRLSLDIGTAGEVLTDPTNLIALKGLTNLKELSLSIFSDFEAHDLMGTWLEMKNLRLEYSDCVSDDLPRGMQNMKKLESLRLGSYEGVNLPNWICEFQRLERLELLDCFKVEELPLLERLPHLKFLKLDGCSQVKDLGIGSSGNQGGFPTLEMLVLKYMVNLQSIAGTSCEGGVLKEGTLPKLRVLKIWGCRALKKLPMGMEKLPNLTALYGQESWWKNVIWEDDNVETYFHALFKKIKIRVTRMRMSEE